MPTNDGQCKTTTEIQETDNLNSISDYHVYL